MAEVEKIVDKKIVNGEVRTFRCFFHYSFRLLFVCFIRISQIHYYLKLVGFNARYNTWKSVNDLNCDELIFEYEKGQALKILSKFIL